MIVNVYGTGNCANCQMLYRKVKEIIEKNNIDAHLEHITDLNVAVNKGIIQLPALEIDGKIVISGRVPKEKQLLKFFA